MTNKQTPCIEPRLQRAWAIFRNASPRAAVDWLQQQLTVDANAGPLWQQRAIMLCRLRRYDEALDNITRAQLLTPLSFEGQLAAAAALWHTGRGELAADLLRELACREALDESEQRELLELLAMAGQWHHLAGLTRRLLSQCPDDDQYCFLLATAFSKLGRPPEVVVRLLERAVRLAPDRFSYRLSLAIFYCRMGDQLAAYREIGRMPDRELRALSCRCCLAKLLAACCQAGDSDRAAQLARQWATASRNHQADNLS
jgi:thioredoxin-like negative regulator of GroEL